MRKLTWAPPAGAGIVAAALFVAAVPASAAARSSLAEASTAPGAGRHLVTFSSAHSVPGDLARRVSALGGSVESVHGSIGVAAVAGLTDAAATALASSPGVSGVIPDVMVAGGEAAAVEQPVAARTRPS